MMKSRISLLAQDVRKILKGAFPDMKFSVTTDTFAGGCSMDVHIVSATEPLMIVNENWTTEYAQLNQYRLQNEWNENEPVCNGVILTKFGWDTMQKVVTLTDAIADFHYFYGVSIGRSFIKPFVLAKR